ncbi:N-acetylaspartylglutamate synthase [Plasmodiophora brassicae]
MDDDVHEALSSAVTSMVPSPAVSVVADDSARDPVVWVKTGNSPLGRLPTTVVEAAPATDTYAAFGTIPVRVPAHFTRFGLRPRHCGPSVLFLNAEDAAFYGQTLDEPALTVWCLCRDDGVTGYVKRRLWEASFARNIVLKVVATGKFELLATKDGLEDILYDGYNVEMPDIVLVRTGAAVDYFGLAVVRQIEKMGVTVLNGCQSIEISRDKLQTMQVMAAHGLPIAKTLLAKFPINLKVVESQFEYPIIVKKSSGSQGKGIILVKDHENLEDLVDLLDPKEPLIFQEFLAHSKGRDLRVLVVGGRVVTCMMRVANKGFKANVHQGGSVRPVTISPQVEWLVLEATRLTGLDVAGIDLLIDKDTYKICEINSSPGFEGLEAATGVDVASATLAYIKLRMGLYRIPRRRHPRPPAPSLEVEVEEDHREADSGTGEAAPPAGPANSPAVPSPH